MFMRALLVKKNVWDVVSGLETLPAGSPNSKPVHAFRRKQAEAIAEITLNVEPTQLIFIQGDDPNVVWDSLTKVHQARGMASRLALRRRFLRLEKPEGPMQNFIAEARRLALQLQEIGVTVEDEDTILVLTGGLPPSYDNFVVALDSAPSDLTLDYVITRLLNEESRQLNGEASYAESALAARYKPGEVKTVLSHITCWKCGKKGHYQSNCKKEEEANLALSVVVEEDKFFILRRSI